MKNILNLIVGLAFLVGCNDNVDKSKPAAGQVYPIYTNDFRVTDIEGRNEYWGDFKLLFEYNGDKLGAVWRVNTTKDTVGMIRISRSDEFRMSAFYVDDWIPGISQDSIDRMDIIYKARYGEGKYSLRDSIPLVSRTVMSCINSYYPDSRIYQQEYMYYCPHEDVGVTGVNFDNTYIQIRKIKYLYEYNDDGRIAIARYGQYTYPDNTNLAVFDTRQGKYEMEYESGSVVSVGSYMQLQGSSYEIVAEYVMSYIGSRLGKVSAIGYQKTFEYSGNDCTVTENGKMWKYHFDAEGYPVRIENPVGEYMTVKYEKGSGDLEVLTPFFDRIMGSPFIK